MKPPETPKLDSVEMTATANGTSERLSEIDYLILEQLLRYKEQPVNRISIASTLGDEAQELPDRVIDKAMLRVMQKTNALYNTFPLVRRINRDSWIYTEVAPKKRKARS